MPDDKSIAFKHNNSTPLQLELDLQLVDPAQVEGRGLANLEALPGGLSDLDADLPGVPDPGLPDLHIEVERSDALTGVDLSALSTHWMLTSAAAASQTYASLSLPRLSSWVARLLQRGGRASPEANTPAWERGSETELIDSEKGVKNQTNSGTPPRSAEFQKG